MPLLTRNVAYLPGRRTSVRRKIAIGTWKTAADPSIYGVVDLDVEKAQAYLEKARQKSGKKITLTVLGGKAMAETIRRHPAMNSVLRRGRIWQRPTVDLFFLVAVDPEGKDLTGTKIKDCDKKSIIEIAAELEEAARRIRAKQDKSFEELQGMLGIAPGWMSRFIMGIGEFIMFTLNLWTPLLGVPRDPFGGVIVTSLGSLGLDLAFAPLVPYMRIGLVAAMGEARDRAVVRDGQVTVVKQMRVCATIDHRIIDGLQAARMSKTMTEIFADPEKELGPL